MKLIKLKEDHYIIVDETEINLYDWCLMFDDFGNIFLGNQPKQYLGEKAGHRLNKGLRKVTHSTQPIEFAWAQEGRDIVSKKVHIKVDPLSLQEVKELIGEVDVVKKAISYCQDWEFERVLGSGSNGLAHDSYFTGYTQALEDNKDKKYTEEDLNKALSWGYHAAKDEAKGIGSSGYGTRFFESIQSKPKTEWEVEFIDGKLTLKNQTK